MATYVPTIGLEIHAELKTRTKMFCSSKNDADEVRPNFNVCPVCLAHPGTLPVINQEAVRHVLRVGNALKGTIADYTEFDRKNYFYPDLPKGYQISQYEYPLVSGGSLNEVQITRIHLEEDTASLMHAEEHQRISADMNLRQSASLVDYNRAGVPLMELVTEPVIKSAEEAGTFARELQLLLRYLNASEANMEKGEMRVEANVSVAKAPETADSRGYEERIHADTEDTKLLYKELTYKIRGAAFAVYNVLGSGHKESVYQNAFAEHLKKVGISYAKEQSIGVSYEGKRVGSYQPDFVIDNKIIIELKALPFVGDIERRQVRYYLKNSSYRLALLINFGSSPIGIERIVYDHIRHQTQISADSHPRISADNPRISAELGTKVEIKNLNSFRIMEKAVAYEIKRQQELLERGEKVAQETRGWDEKTGKTFSQRVKEGSADYRYFPDPDLPSLKLSEVEEFLTDALLKDMPELPAERRARYKGLGIKAEDADLYVRETRLGGYFEAVVEGYKPQSRELILASNYIANDLVKIIRLRSAEARKSEGEDKGAPSRQVRDMEERDSEVQPEFLISARYFQEIIRMLCANEISSRAAKDLLALSISEKRSPSEIAKEKGLFQTISTSDIEAVIAEVILKNPRVVSDFKAGKTASLEYLIGQCIKALRGAGDPIMLRALILKQLE
ncbi:MAG: GxxExxY protein [bacterium]|nr:GxxExxY protein [bacterium]